MYNSILSQNHDEICIFLHKITLFKECEYQLVSEILTLQEQSLHILLSVAHVCLSSNKHVQNDSLSMVLV